jgi:two-component system response regulator MprA
MQILVVEDDARMGELLKRGLGEEGHHVILASDGAHGLEIARASEFDVIVLDVMLPSLDGITLAKRLRAARNQTPILLLTAKDGIADTIRGLDSGADDYLTKPFSFEILLARLRAVSRRGVIPRPVCLEVADLKLDPATHGVTRDGQHLNLTPREYTLLELLMRNHARVVSRDTILSSVWGHYADVTENTLEAFVRLLRMKVDTREPKLIHTVRGVGYVVREPEH